LKTAHGRSSTAQERGRLLFRLSEKVRANLPALAELESRNTGKPIVEAEYDINDAATCFEYYGGMATKVRGARESRARQCLSPFRCASPSAWRARSSPGIIRC
jgi:acyl-CoA reductase-like NAD-dependent aldehyde dehydrogenase